MEAILQQKEGKANQLHELKGYYHNLEMARQEQYELLLSSTDKDIQRRAARRMASLTALRNPAYVKELEFKKFGYYL